MTIHKHAPAPNRDAEQPRAPEGEAEGSWECGDCGWILREDNLPDGRSVADAAESHTEKYCGRPSYWAPP